MYILCSGKTTVSEPWISLQQSLTRKRRKGWKDWGLVEDLGLGGEGGEGEGEERGRGGEGRRGGGREERGGGEGGREERGEGGEEGREERGERGTSTFACRFKKN